jgi:hypothetical protein
MILKFLLYLYNFLLSILYKPKKVHFLENKNTTLIIHEIIDDEENIIPIKKTISKNNLIEKETINLIEKETINLIVPIEKKILKKNSIRGEIIYDKNNNPLGIWICLSKNVVDYGFYFSKNK